MKLKLLFLCSLFMIMLTGCGPIYETHYRYQPPRTWSGRRCVNQCLNTRTACQMDCRQENDRCRVDAKRNAREDYYAYVHTQKEAHKPIKRSIDDFVDYSGCSSRCSCTPSYNTCYANCGGAVTTYEVCTAFCPKPKPHVTVTKVNK